MSIPAEHEETHDGEAVAACLRGDDAALTGLRQQHYGRLISILVRRGATPAEAEEIVADIWSELVTSHGGKRPLLEKYQPRSPLGAWLLTIGTHRLIDRRRRGKLFAGSIDDHPEPGEVPKRDGTGPGSQSDMRAILRGAVAEAFASCPPESLVMLKLVYLHGVTRRDISKVWRWHESKVSRHLDGAEKDIQRRLLARIKHIDGLLEVNWNDFLDLCQCTPDLFGATR